MTGKKSKWYDEGIRFECQGSGNCCTSRGEYGYVYFDSDDIKIAAKALGISPKSFQQTHCQKVDGVWALKDNPKGPDCIFLDKKKCKIYAGRPTQCRTWPFWPEIMNAKSWKKDVEAFCPGINRGRLYEKSEIEAIMQEQKNSELKMQSTR